jgi:hypothetical protein
MTKGGGQYLQSGRACPSGLLGDGNLPPKCPSAYLQSGWEAGRWVAMAPCPSAYLQSGWEAGRWVAASSNPLRPRFVLSSPCAKIRRDRCSGIAGCDFQADSDWRGMRGDRPVMGKRRPESIITMREFIVTDSENQF